MTIANATASIYTEREDVYYIKLSMPDIGMHISGITVKKSPKYGGWWVQMPYYSNRNGNTKNYIEFDEESPARRDIERPCIEAVENK